MGTSVRQRHGESESERVFAGPSKEERRERVTNGERWVRQDRTEAKEYWRHPYHNF